MQSEKVLEQYGIEKDTYPADAVFEAFNLIGTYSKDGQTVCIMVADNVSEAEQESNFDACVLSKEAIMEIACTVKVLITDFGCAVHSHTMKHTKPFSNLTIKKYVHQF